MERDRDGEREGGKGKRTGTVVLLRCPLWLLTLSKWLEKEGAGAEGMVKKRKRGRKRGKREKRGERESCLYCGVPYGC